MSGDKTRWAKGIALLLLLLAVLIPTGRVAAADFRSGERVVVEEDEVVDDDLFASGGEILIEGTVTGDLFASGGRVVIDGVVEGSAFIAANTAVIPGDVNGSLYAGLYSLTLDQTAVVGRNVYLGGFSFNAQPQSSIGRDVYASSYQTLANGTIAGDLVANSAALQLGGEVGGDVQAEVAAADQTFDFMQFMPDFDQDIPILTPGLQVSDDAVVGGELDVVQTERVEDEETVVDVLLERVGELIALLLVGGLWILIAPLLLARAGDAAQTRPLPSAGLGCLVTLVFPLALLAIGALVIMLIVLGGFLTAGQLTAELIGLGGAGVALLVAGFGLAFSILTKVVIAYLLGRLILGRSAPATAASRGRHFAYLALGAVLYEIVRAIPFLGFLVAVVVILLGLGALFLALRNRPKQPQPALS